MPQESISVQIYDTMSARKRLFEPIKPGKVGMYVCGLTVYDLSHVGHARTFIVFDVIRRYLTHRGYEVTFVCNHTDVDDKIINRANQVSEDPCVLAEQFIDCLCQDMSALGIGMPDLQPRVTQEIPTIIAMVERLVERNHAYVVDGDVFFDVSSFSGYGKLSKKNIEDLRAGERIAVDERKRHPYDFVLWKAAKPNEPNWESPWGKGRPGWHIECSAMSTRYLGDTIDIHGGGRDLVFPHHENELAQSEGATGKPFVNYWIHVGPLTIDGEKMSKSLGNFWTVREVLKIHHPEVIRFFMLTGHYRKPISYNQEGLDEARQRVVYFYKTLLRLNEVEAANQPVDEGPTLSVDLLKRYWDDVHKAMDDDFSTPRFLALLTELAKTANEILPPRKLRVDDPKRLRTLLEVKKDLEDSGKLLGLFCQHPAEALREIRALRVTQRELDSDQILGLLEERNRARAEKNWARADEIRDELLGMRVSLMDGPSGTEWEVE